MNVGPFYPVIYSSCSPNTEAKLYLKFASGKPQIKMTARFAVARHSISQTNGGYCCVLELEDTQTLPVASHVAFYTLVNGEIKHDSVKIHNVVNYNGKTNVVFYTATLPRGKNFAAAVEIGDSPLFIGTIKGSKFIKDGNYTPTYRDGSKPNSDLLLIIENVRGEAYAFYNYRDKIAIITD